MHPWIEECEKWLVERYRNILRDATPVFRWLGSESLTLQVERAKAEGMVIEDAEIAWVLFLLPYRPEYLEKQVSESLSVRSRLLVESNYTGNSAPTDQEDSDSSWRIGLMWLVGGENWSSWQRQVLELRRESGAAEEVALDGVRITNSSVKSSLDSHAFPRLLLETRALIGRTSSEAVSWLTADDEVSAELKDFSKRFSSARSREFARELEKHAGMYTRRKSPDLPSTPRLLERFHLKDFRNIESLEIAAESLNPSESRGIVLFGPNGTGKTSVAEGLSLAAFGTSPRMERFLADQDLRQKSPQAYHDQYLTPIGTNHQPSFIWNSQGETSFVFRQGEENLRSYEGVILNQEDSLRFTWFARRELASLVVRGYSELADYLSNWLIQEESKTKEVKERFARAHGLSTSIRLSETAYDRLAQVLFSSQLKRPSPEFLSWLDFLGRSRDEAGHTATQLASRWRTHQSNVVTDLSATLAKLRASGSTETAIAVEIKEKLTIFDSLTHESEAFRKEIEARLSELREQLDAALSAIDTWGEWLIARKTKPTKSKSKVKKFMVEMDEVATARTDLEKRGKMLRGRSDLLVLVEKFLDEHWADDHPDTCPVCASDVSKRNGIKGVVGALQGETNQTLQALREEYVRLQNQQRDLTLKLQAAGDSTSPIPIDEQARLIEWLTPYVALGAGLEESLVDPKRRKQLKADLSRMKIIPASLTSYSDVEAEANRLAQDFCQASDEADQALEGPQAISEVRKALEERIERVLVEHLPSTLGRVWIEIALALTSAPWLLPALPELKLESRGKALSVRLKDSELLTRYVYNAAELHVLGLAWFFTYFLAKRRFAEGWMVLDDAAQEMDQPSFRELMRFCETLLRLARRGSIPLTMVLGLHQEDRALAAARATNARLYMLGWQKRQDDSAEPSSVRKMVLLAPGFHPLKPGAMFG